MQPLRLTWVWSALGACLIGGVVVLCLLPARDLPALSVSDSFEHAAAYLALMLWFAGLAKSSHWLQVASALFVLGTGLEWLQGAMALGRIADPRDVVANSLGIALGIGVAHAGLGGWMGWVEAKALRL